MKNRSFKVYMHIFPNGKRYIGLTCQTTAQRWARGRGYVTQFVKNAINKYGWDNIEHVVIEDGLTEDEAYQLEADLIAFYRSNEEDYGYNISSGGPHTRYGLHNSPEHNQRIALSHKKRVICFTRAGKPIATFESVMDAADFIKGGFRVISSCCCGTKKSAYGYIWRFEGDPFDKYPTENKKGGQKGFPVKAFLNNGELIGVFPTVKAAAIACGVRQDAIADVCRGRRESVRNMRFQYITEGGQENGTE